MAAFQKLKIDLNKPKKNFRKDFEPNQYVTAWLENDCAPNSTNIETALVVILRTIGCNWARSESSKGGCNMCGYLNDCIPDTYKISNKDIVEQFSSALEKFNDSDFKFVKIFSSGSFFDTTEISKKAQDGIIDLLNQFNVQTLLLESRPRFVTESAIGFIQSKFSGKLQLAIGLESCNDNVLKYSINKGFSFDDYIQAVKIAQNMDTYLKTYLLLKPPFLTECEAIFDATNSIKILSKDHLTDCISINPVNIQRFTLVEHLYRRNEYRPPWLWSVVEVLKRGYEIISETKIRILSQPTAAGTRRGTHNCGECDKTIINAINDFSLINDTANIRKLVELYCHCIENWKDVIDLENIAMSNIS